MKTMLLAARVALAVLAVASCAKSTGGGDPADTDTDTDTDTDADTDADTDVDTDVDSDADTDTDTDADGGECECFNEQDACCDGCYWESEDFVCDPHYLTEYQCESADCGAAVQARYKARHCPGDMASCVGAVDEEFGEWENISDCEDYQVCTMLEEEAVCLADLATCGLDFDERVCLPSGSISDCGSLAGCEEPEVSAQTFAMPDMGPGQVLLMEFYAAPRIGSMTSASFPFSDLHGWMTHGDTTVNFYNNYDGIVESGALFDSYYFPEIWYLPHFWGEEIVGNWTITFEDSEYSGMFAPAPVDVVEICFTFYSPGSVTPITEGDWSSDEGGTVAAAATSKFELQVEDVGDGSVKGVWLDLDFDTVAEPQTIKIDLVAADGTLISVKDNTEAALHKSYEIVDMTTKWLSGRYQLQITNGGTAAVTLNSWAVRAGEAALDGGVDAGR